jgi:C-terminal processing protease CtpA/Prc
VKRPLLLHQVKNKKKTKKNMKSLLTIIALVFNVLLWSQTTNYTKTDVLKDLQYLNKAVTTHPINYKRPVKISLQNFIDSCEKALPEQLTWHQYEFLLRDAVAQIGCVHTALASIPARHTPVIKSLKTYPLSMYKFQSLQDTLGTAVGDKITQINGVSSSVLLSKLLTYRGGDGNSTALSEDILTYSLPSILYRLLGKTDSFDLEINGTQHVKMAAQAPKNRIKRETPTLPVLYATKTDTIYQNGETAVWKIRSFGRKSSYNAAGFNILKVKNIKNVIFDFRGNTGGNFTVGGDLLTYFVKETAEFRMMGNYKAARYLDSKSKFTLLPLGIFLYEGVRGFRKRFEKGQWYLSYKYKPRKETFQGKTVVLMDGYTLSTSSLVASFLKHKAGATLIGSESAGGETDNNGGLFPTIKLPKSEVKISFPMKQLIYQIDKTPKNTALKPDIEVEYALEDIINGVDKDLKKAFDFIKK